MQPLKQHLTFSRTAHYIRFGNLYYSIVLHPVCVCAEVKQSKTVQFLLADISIETSKKVTRFCTMAVAIRIQWVQPHPGVVWPSVIYGTKMYFSNVSYCLIAY